MSLFSLKMEAQKQPGKWLFVPVLPREICDINMILETVAFLLLFYV
jgi:hypothetical protein